MTSPRFSVLLPTKNRLELLACAIATVQRQDYGDWELVVADNCSTDNVDAYVQGLNDSRIVYIRSDNPLPVTDNWNRALDAATGDYIVMLGDDDGLVPGYFERSLEVLENLEHPDFLYHGAYHYAFPGVMPGFPEGYLHDVTLFQSILRIGSHPVLMPPEKARSAAQKALNMKAVYGFNMQYFLFSRAFLQRMRAYGPVFQGPFPDFYAANLAMLLAERIGLVPEPLTIIGISPKSYGFFHFNRREEEGISFLNNEDFMGSVPEALKKRLLPGSNMYTSWLVSVALVAEAFKGHPDIRLNIQAYRMRQIKCLLCGILQHEIPKNSLSDVWMQLDALEKVLVAALLLALTLFRILPEFVKPKAIRVIDYFCKQYVPIPPDLPGPTQSRSNNILDAFETLANLHNHAEYSE